MNKKLIGLTESDLHKIVKESVNKIINEIGDTEKGQDALAQARGRADKRNKLLRRAMGNKYRKISHDAQEKAYSQGEKHGFDIYDPNGAYDKGISKGYEKALAKEPRLHKIVKESVNKVLREGINDITPLSTHIQNNQDTDLETLGNIVDDLRKVKEGGALSKWNPTIAARLRKSGLVDTETVQAITQINLLIYRLGNMDFSHKRVYNGETFDDTWNRLQHEQD